jgi:beta-hydroxylase
MKWGFFGIYLLSIAHIHFRGKVRLPIARQLFDHSSLMAPINAFMHWFSRVPSTPYISLAEFKDMARLQDNWTTIREEARNLLQLQKIKAAEKNDDAGFNSFFKEGWKRFYLKWYDASHPSAAELCPKTHALLQSMPSVKAALFAELPPHAKLNPHRDPFGGSLRYHLGLITPNDDQCFIEVDGERYSWRDGKGVMFDETYIHWATNGTETNRIILFCDVERPMRYRWAQAVNHFLGKILMSAAASPNESGDQVGVISKLFLVSYHMGVYRRRFKAWNKVAYKVTKFALIVGAAALIYFI